MEKDNLKKENVKVGESFDLLETGAKDAPVADVKWHGQEVEVKSDKLEDEGSGKPIIMRMFEFELPKDIPKQQLPNKDQLLLAHKGKITAYLWKDELELVQDMKIVQSKNKRGFRIFATCQPKKGSILSSQHTINRLQDVMQPNAKRK